MSTEPLLTVVRETLLTTDYCFFITLNEFGGADTRLMQPFPADEDLTIWFVTAPDSRKVRHLKRDNRVTLAFLDRSETAYVTLSGLATMEADPEERQRHWRSNWTAFFPDDPTGGEYTLLKFVPHRIEVMNFARELAPAPFGLLPVVLVRDDAGWQVVTQNHSYSYALGYR